MDLTVEPGDVYGYLGPNGAGKTTSLRMMLGLIRPTEGTVRLFGRDPLASVDGARRAWPGSSRRRPSIPYLSARRNLELLAAFDGGGAAERIDEALDTVELSDRAGDRVGGYSPRDEASGWGSPPRCCAIRGCWCSMSRPPGSIRRGCATCGG